LLPDRHDKAGRVDYGTIKDLALSLWWLAPVKFLLPEDAEPRAGVNTKQSQEKIVGVDRLQVERCQVPLAAGRLLVTITSTRACRAAAVMCRSFGSLVVRSMDGSYPTIGASGKVVVDQFELRRLSSTAEDHQTDPLLIGATTSPRSSGVSSS